MIPGRHAEAPAIVSPAGVAPASSPLPAATEPHPPLVTDALVFDLTAVPRLTFRNPSSSPLARLVAHVLLRVWFFGLVPAPAQHAMVTVWPLAFVLSKLSRPLVVPTAEPASEEGVVPHALPQTPSHGQIAGGGSGHGARSRRERAITLGEGQAAAALSRELYSGVDFGLYDPDLYEYTTPDGRRFLVHQTGGLRRMADPSGNTLVIDAGGITHSSGRGVTFTRDAQGRITAITDPAARSCSTASTPRATSSR